MRRGRVLEWLELHPGYFLKRFYAMDLDRHIIKIYLCIRGVSLVLFTFVSREF